MNLEVKVWKYIKINEKEKDSNTTDQLLAKPKRINTNYNHPNEHRMD